MNEPLTANLRIDERTGKSEYEKDLGETRQARELLRMLPIMMRLPDEQAWALAQFCKRICWSDMRGLACDNAEAEQMRSAIYTLQRALSDNGFASR